MVGVMSAVGLVHGDDARQRARAVDAGKVGGDPDAGGRLDDVGRMTGIGDRHVAVDEGLGQQRRLRFWHRETGIGDRRQCLGDGNASRRRRLFLSRRGERPESQGKENGGRYAEHGCLPWSGWRAGATIALATMMASAGDSHVFASAGGLFVWTFYADLSISPPFRKLRGKTTGTPWPAIHSSRTSCTARAARTRCGRKCFPSWRAKSPSPPRWARPIRT